MRRLSPLADVVAGLAFLATQSACSPQITPDGPPAGSTASAFWLGDWVVDVGALAEVESFRALTPEAQAVTRQLVTGAQWRLAFESQRAHLADGRLLGYRVEQSDATHAVLALTTGEHLTLERRPGGLRLAERDLPLRRAE